MPQKNSATTPVERPWHTLPGEEVLHLLSVDAHAGLTDSEAGSRLQQYGPNQLKHSRGRSAISILIAQFASLIVGLLVAATVVAFLLGEYIEAGAILIVIMLNALIGFLTEWKAELTLSALEKQTVPSAKVVRDGRQHEVPAVELVPGDIVLLAAGDRVPADGRVLECARLLVEEAALTGESVASEKNTMPAGDNATPLGDRHNMVYMGTAVTDGRGRLVVTATGARTEIGHIGKLLDEATSRESPLERKLEQLGRALVLIVIVLSGIIVFTGWLRGHPFLQMLEVGISLAIAAVPEGLPAVATMTLAIGMQRMARMRAIVRRLPAVETLGSTTTICTDKTGTLTRNEMTVRVYQFGPQRVEVTGVGYEVRGEFRAQAQRLQIADEDQLRRALEIGALCNDARLHNDPAAGILGDPTEAALLVAAEKAGLRHDELLKQFPRVAEIPFSSDSQRMITIHRASEKKGLIACLKGSPASLIADCRYHQTSDGVQPLAEADREYLLAQNEELAGKALRVLALAWRELPDNYTDKDLASELVFAGLTGMIDPLREEARAAIAICGEAGIRVVMITGDQPATAREIGRQLGLGAVADHQSPVAVHGRELSNLDERGWDEIVRDTAVFARVTPEHKLRIVEAMQRQGEIVAMTGDGVNDAPALKKADIGVAMGIKGTEVAKEASAMIITDDNFATIVGAVEQGRIIYSNIVRFIHYLFSCNFSEIITVFVPILSGWPLPLAALQILWLNLITDVFPAMALALEPSAPGLMRRPPRNPKEPLLSVPFLWMITWQALLLAAGTLTGFYVGLRWYGLEGIGLRHAETIAFMTLALAQVFHVFGARSQRRSAILSSPFRNGWLWMAVLTCILLQLAAVYWSPLNRVLHTVPLDSHDWLLVALCALAPAFIVEGVKFVRHLTIGDA